MSRQHNPLLYRRGAVEASSGLRVKLFSNSARTTRMTPVLYILNLTLRGLSTTVESVVKGASESNLKRSATPCLIG
jgi:hypothetical protein